MATANKNLSEYNLSDVPSGRGKKIGVVVAEWNEEITFGMRDGAIDTLEACGVYKRDILVHTVPGSFELPLGADWLLQNEEVDGVIAIGCVIRGETSHFDYVCQGTTYGIQRLNLDYHKPVMFCVLTDNNIEQSRARSGGKLGNKGVEAAVAVLKMLHLKSKVKRDS